MSTLPLANLERPLDGKTVVVTGATSGIGHAAALGLAGFGATVGIVGRDEGRVKRTVGEIRELGGRANGFVADLSSQREVRQLARRIADGGPLHVLVNNAAVVPRHRETTEDGIEMQLAVNHLAPFLLTNLLLDALRTAGRPGDPARIVNVASQVHYDASIHWDDLGLARGYEPSFAYNQSKLANVMFTIELARRLEGSGVTANCLHPGVVGTRLLNDLFGRSRLMMWSTRRNHAPPEEGARTILWLATSAEVAEVSGRYFKDCAEQVPSDEALDVAAQKRLWGISERMVGLAAR